MALYRKRPVPVEAFRLGHDEPPAWAVAAASYIEGVGRYIELRRGWDHIEVITPEGSMAAYAGDWLIRGVVGELYPCQNSVFLMSYDDAWWAAEPVRSATGPQSILLRHDKEE